MNRIKQLRNMLGYTQAQLANLLHISRSAVAMWETTEQKPDYDTLRQISQAFNVPTDFILGKGIFADWDKIKENYPTIVGELKKMIPADLELPLFCEDKYLIAWLDTRLYREGDADDELQLIRWFAFAIKEIRFTSADDEYADSDISVSIQFTPEFRSLITATAPAKTETAAPEGDGSLESDEFLKTYARLSPAKQSLVQSLVRELSSAEEQADDSQD